jgi:hypothetical protein
MILVYNAENVLQLLGVMGPAVLVAQVAIVGISLAICAWVLRGRRQQRHDAQPAGKLAGVPEPHLEQAPLELEGTS